MSVFGFICYLQGLVHGITVAGIGVALWAREPEWIILILPVGLLLSFIVGAAIE